LLGVGGSAGNASHAVNDFRKLCALEAYAPTDNVSELSARKNDEGLDGALAAWLRISRLSSKDALLILSVGGGNRQQNVSVNLIQAVDLAREQKAKVFGIVGRDVGHAKLVGDVVVVIPPVSDKHVTPHSEASQAVVWHCLVSHPSLQMEPTKW
jgi:D-sedoheptulose 7-phosphate isomerase